MPRSSSTIVSLILDALQRNPGDLKDLILTHYHMDHVGSVAVLVKLIGAEVAIHEIFPRLRLGGLWVLFLESCWSSFCPNL